MTEPTLTARDAALDWFGSDLPAETRSVLAEIARVRAYDTGDVVFREGEEAASFGVVRRGRVALKVLVPERGETTILTVEPGDVVNWSAMVPPYRSTSTGRALEPTEVVWMDGAALRGVLRSDCLFASHFYPRLLQAVARRLVGTREQLLDVFAHEAEPAW
jgi:CRP-like cAMP-binding protein